MVRLALDGEGMAMFDDLTFALRYELTVIISYSSSHGRSRSP